MTVITKIWKPSGNNSVFSSTFPQIWLAALLFVIKCSENRNLHHYHWRQGLRLHQIQLAWDDDTFEGEKVDWWWHRTLELQEPPVKKYKKQCWQEPKGVWGLRRVDQWPQSMAFKVKKVPFRKPTLAKLSPTCICSFVRVPSVEISATSSDILVFNQINWPWRNQTTFYGFYIFFSLIISQWYL